ncbi:MAG: nucleotidyl transferase AbiEii/AbiGii toxin family protein [Burkholderiaceae bacterium]|nr:nucleotidyl transferase AbiEii/AbiGii toxin family protein [Burkholderiaceae bacterium]
MTGISPRLHARPDRPVDALLVEILRRVDAVTRELHIDYFVGGAVARDLILAHVFGKDTGRATRDVDLGICIDDWEQLDLLKAKLIQGDDFLSDPRIPGRLIYRREKDVFGIHLDLLPFGGVENADATIAWPPGMDIVMNVAGFAEARSAALMVAVADGVVVPVASLPSLSVLKLVAWRERHLTTSKDATDFLLIARHYHGAGQLDRLYETESAMLQATDFDPEVAGAMLLGKDAAEICLPATARSIRFIFTDPQLGQRLSDQLLRRALASGDAAGSARVDGLVDAFCSGFGVEDKR